MGWDGSLRRHTSAGATVPPWCFHPPPSPQTRCRDKSSSGWQKPPFPSQGFIASANCSQLSAPSPACTSAKEVGAGRRGTTKPSTLGTGAWPCNQSGIPSGTSSLWNSLAGAQAKSGPHPPPSGAPTLLCSMTRKQRAGLTLLQAHSLEGSLRSHSKGRQRHFPQNVIERGKDANLGATQDLTAYNNICSRKNNGRKLITGVAVIRFSGGVTGVSSFISSKLFGNEITEGWKEKKLLHNEFCTCRHCTFLN